MRWRDRRAPRPRRRSGSAASRRARACRPRARAASIPRACRWAARCRRRRRQGRRAAAHSCRRRARSRCGARTPRPDPHHGWRRHSARASGTAAMPPSSASLMRAVERKPHLVMDVATYSTLSEHVARAFAPGRVNLIGEHTDYNEGLAMPFAVTAGVTVTATRLERRTVEAVAHDIGERDDVQPARPGRRPRAGARLSMARWPSCGASGTRLPAARIEITGDLPRGRGCPRRRRSSSRCASR